MKKCKKGSKGKRCHIINYSKRIFPDSIKTILIWILGALIEVLGFFLLFAKKKVILGIFIAILGFLIALASRGKRN